LRDSRSWIGEGDPLPPGGDFDSSKPERVEAIYRAHGPRLLRFLRRRTSAGAADDLAQQAFVRLAALDAGAVATIRRPNAYLCQTATNLLRDAARAAARRGESAHIDIDVAMVPAPDQIAALEARDMLARLEAALTKLNPRTREIFLAHRVDGYSYLEIAARTGLGVKAIEKHMSRAIAQIDRYSSRR
jgi:RNA polymerase sigma factor (sigma-70 family)